MTTKQVGFKAPVGLAIALNATSPNPGFPGVRVWSSVTNSSLEWNGSSWVSGSGVGSVTNAYLSGANVPNAFFQATLGYGQGNVVAQSGLGSNFNTVNVSTVVTNIGGFTLSGGIVTVPITGLYRMNGQIRLLDASPSCNVGVGIDIANGDSPAFVWNSHNSPASGVDRWVQQYTRTMFLNAGDQPRLFMYCDGATVSISDAALTLQLVQIVDVATQFPVAVRVAALSNVSISSPGATIDAVTLTNGDKVLLTAQSTGSQNGAYTFNGSASAMTRIADMDSSLEVTPGRMISVYDGTSKGSTWMSVTTNVTLGTTSLVFQKLSSASGIARGSMVLDFGTAGSATSLSYTVTGQSGITANSIVQIYVSGDASTSDHTAEQHRNLPVFMAFTVGSIIPGTGFTIYAKGTTRNLTGTYLVNWMWQ